MKNSTILITGSSGYLGKRLCQKLAASSANIIALKRTTSRLEQHNNLQHRIIYHDYQDKNSLETLFAAYSIDLIIHCATNYTINLSHAVDSLNANVLLPLQLLELAHRFNKPTFINIGTILDPRISIYALSKNQLTDWMHFFAQDMACTNVLLSQFYGPYDDNSKFCSMIIKSLLNETHHIDLTLGEQQRDFIHISDVVDAISLIAESCMNSVPGYQKFDVGTGENHKLRDFVQLTQQLTENFATKLNFGALNYRAGEVFEYPLDLDPLFSLGWKAKYDLKSGLKDVISKERKTIFEEA